MDINRLKQLAGVAEDKPSATVQYVVRVVNDGITARYSGNGNYFAFDMTDDWAGLYYGGKRRKWQHDPAKAKKWSHLWAAKRIADAYNQAYDEGVKDPDFFVRVTPTSDNGFSDKRSPKEVARLKNAPKAEIGVYELESGKRVY